MLLRHSISYFLIRGMSGLLGLLAIFLFARLLTPAEYGLYALALAGVNVTSTVFFQWLNVGLGRFMPAHHEHPQIILTTVAAGYLCSLFITGILLGVVLWFWPDQATIGVVLLSGLVGWGQAWFDLNLRTANVRLDPVRYGLLSVGKSVSTIAMGAGLIYLGYGVRGLLVGIFAAMILTSAAFGWRDWIGTKFRYFSGDLFVRVFRYGTPLTVMFLLILVVDVSGRIFLGWYSSTSDVGVYAVTCDLVQWSLATLMGVISLAGFPLVVQALESGGVSAAELRLRQYALVMFGVGIPSALGLCVLADNIAGVILGEKFHRDAAILIPWLAIGVFLGCTKAFYFDLSFQLGSNTKRQAVVAACAATINILLNMWWIPTHGALGAAYSMVAAIGSGLLASWYFGMRTFKLPALHRDTYKIVLASIAMALVLWPSRSHVGPVALGFQLALGVATYIAMVVLLNVEGSRAIVTMFSQRIWNAAPTKRG